MSTPTNPVCTGTGANGGHCCWIDGNQCELLEVVDGQPRCPLWAGMMAGNPLWESLPIGQWFARTHPGYDCRDWPQNIPEVMADGIGLCCWQGVS